METPTPLRSWEELSAELDRQVRIEDGCIVIGVEYPYEIELDRCDTPLKTLSWVHHLMGRAGMEPQVLKRFIEVAAAHHGYSVFGAA